MKSHKSSHTKKDMTREGVKAIRIDVPEKVNDALIAAAREASEKHSLRITKKDYLGRLLEKFADGQIEIKGSLFLLL